MAASLVLRKEPFFHGHDNYDQLSRIAKVLGTDALHAYLDKYRISLDSHFDDLMAQNYPPKPLAKFVNADNAHIACPEALDFIEKRECVWGGGRLSPTAAAACAHPGLTVLAPPSLSLSPPTLLQCSSMTTRSA